MDPERSISIHLREGNEVRDRKLKFRNSGELPENVLNNELDKFLYDFEEKEKKLLRKVYPVKVIIFLFFGFWN